MTENKNVLPRPPATYLEWLNLIDTITGGEELNSHGGVVGMNEPLVTGVSAPEELVPKHGAKVNVKIVGDSEEGFAIRVRGRWPRSFWQTTYHIVPRDNVDVLVLVASETTGSLLHLLKPSRFEDDFTSAPKDEVVGDFDPELDYQALNVLNALLIDTASMSTAQGHNAWQD